MQIGSNIASTLTRAFEQAGAFARKNRLATAGFTAGAIVTTAYVAGIDFRALASNAREAVSVLLKGTPQFTYRTVDCPIQLWAPFTKEVGVAVPLITYAALNALHYSLLDQDPPPSRMRRGVLSVANGIFSLFCCFCFALTAGVVGGKCTSVEIERQ